MNTRLSALVASLFASGALMLALPVAAAESAAVAAVAPAAAAPAERFEVGSALVERHGDHGSPLILIPGLASGSWVWQDVVSQFKGEHVVYVLTLAGFDGRPAISGNGMQAAEQAVLDLIATRKLVKPVLIGHSLGATLSFAIAAGHADQIGGLVAIDGMPVFPGTEAMEPAQRAQLAEGRKARMTTNSQEQFAQQQLMYMRGMGVIDPVKAEQLAKLSARSDPAATLRYMGEDLVLDLRAGLPKISVPVLVISPFYEPDGKMMNMTAAGKAAYYKALLNGTPKLEVVSVEPARHFAMVDQPKAVGDALANYLKTLH